MFSKKLIILSNFEFRKYEDKKIWREDWNIVIHKYLDRSKYKNSNENTLEIVEWFNSII